MYEKKKSCMSWLFHVLGFLPKTENAFTSLTHTHKGVCIADVGQTWKNWFMWVGVSSRCFHSSGWKKIEQRIICELCGCLFRFYLLLSEPQSKKTASKQNTGCRRKCTQELMHRVTFKFLQSMCSFKYSPNMHAVSFSFLTRWEYTSH